jgi:nitrite reductase (cytochrome c-552)
MACKSADINKLYEKYGDAVLSTALPSDPNYSGKRSITSPGKAATGDESITIWNCTTCHSDISNPKGSLGAHIVYWNLIAGNLKEKVHVKNAVCGQCHNVLDPYRFVVEATGKSLKNLDAYKYGYDADSWRKAFLENADYTKGKAIGDIFRIDQKSGTVDTYVTHPDVEMFQDSTHQSLGLTCTSCHMPAETSVTGESYTRHSASLSPLNSEASVKYCLTCHKAQGVTTTEKMVKLVRDKQAAIVGPENELLAKLTTLNNLIAKHVKAADVNESTLDQARELFATAQFYYRWQHGGTATAGIKVAMYTSKGMMQYINRGIANCDRGIALLQ